MPFCSGARRSEGQEEQFLSTQFLTEAAAARTPGVPHRRGLGWIKQEYLSSPEEECLSRVKNAL